MKNMLIVFQCCLKCSIQHLLCMLRYYHSEYRELEAKHWKLYHGYILNRCYYAVSLFTSYTYSWLSAQQLQSFHFVICKNSFRMCKRMMRNLMGFFVSIVLFNHIKAGLICCLLRLWFSDTRAVSLYALSVILNHNSKRKLKNLSFGKKSFGTI